MPGYTMDCFYRDLAGRLEAVPRNRKHIVAADPDEAIKACRSVSLQPQPVYLELRAGGPNGRILYSSLVRAREADPVPMAATTQGRNGSGAMSRHQNGRRGR